MASVRMRPSFLNVWTQGMLVVRLLRDPRVPVWPKALLALVLVYLLSPVDLIPDFAVPGLGYVDDLLLLFLAQRAFVRFCPLKLVQQHLQKN